MGAMIQDLDQIKWSPRTTWAKLHTSEREGSGKQKRIQYILH